MNIFEKTIIILSIIFAIIISLYPWVKPESFDQFVKSENGITYYLALNGLGVILCIYCMVVTFIDLFKRKYLEGHRGKWSLIILLGGTPGWLRYLVMHGFKPRVHNETSA